MSRVLIAGVSTRAAADSAARAGFAVTALDAFADLDQHPAVRALSVTRDCGARFTAHTTAKAARTIDCDAVAYLSSFENHPRAVAALAAGRTLWGNSPEVLRRVRDPFLVASALERNGLFVPQVSPPPGGFGATGSPSVDASGDAGRTRGWVVKPLRSGGGVGIRRWTTGQPVRRGSYLQEFIDGIPASIVFVAARGGAVPLGISRQLVGDAAFGVSEYRYCGNVLVTEADGLNRIVDNACDMVRVIAGEFDLVGLNGIDFIIRNEAVYPIEVNPRWSSSMELVERAYGVSMFGVHAAACARGELPAFDFASAGNRRLTIGKAIVFAREDIDVPDTRAWVNDRTIADVPRPGERIERGHPICTVFAEAETIDECRAALARRARDVYALLTGSQFSVGFSSA